MRKMIRLLLLFLLASLTLCACGTKPTVTPTEPDLPDVSSNPTKPEASTAPSSPETATSQKTPGAIRIGTYNIKSGVLASHDYTKFGDVIKASELDIVGLQEVDYRTDRCYNYDQPALLAEAAGMPYYVFIRAIDHLNGQYGTLILSKYPIVSSEVIPLTSMLNGQSVEARSLGHVVLDIDGRHLDFFNTHLTHINASIRQIQFNEIAENTADCKDFILTGDFNTSKFSRFEGIRGNLINNNSRHYPTLRDNETASIDNIVYTDAFTELASDTVTESHSDHYLLWAEFKWETE